MATQELLGADIQMVLDVCPPLPSPPDVRRARRRAHRGVGGAGPGRPPPRRPGAVRHRPGRHRRRRCGPRAPSAPPSSTSTATASAGCRWGRPAPRCCPALAAAIAQLPADRPRYLMGVGDPASLVEAVALGVDQFDCVMQTRLGRHGTALTGAGRLQRQGGPPRRRGRARSTERCACAVCARHSRGYLRHLFAVGEPTASRLVSLHNVAWTLALLARIRGGDRRRHVRRAAGRGARRLGVTRRPVRRDPSDRIRRRPGATRPPPERNGTDARSSPSSPAEDSRAQGHRFISIRDPAADPAGHVLPDDPPAAPADARAAGAAVRRSTSATR